MMVAWWSHIVLTQGTQIAELESRLGLATESAAGALVRRHRMIFWESLAFYLLLILSSGFLMWAYWRDHKRTRALQAFFASLTHELRTPLTSIRLQAESIAESLASGRDSALVGRLLEDTARLESQVERTLELARVEGGGAVAMRTLRLRPLVDRVLSQWNDAHQGGLSARADLGDFSVQADPVAMQVILRNLLENSVRHSKKEHLEADLGTEREGHWIVLRYRDSGGGFEGDVRLLGQIFHKGLSSHGAGVGLYLIRMLMERMGGRAVFAGREGFEVKLFFKEGVE